LTAHRALRALEISCWIAGIALVLLYVSARGSAIVERNEGIAAFAQARMLAAAPPVAEYAGTERAPDQSRWSESRRQRYAAQMAEPTSALVVPEAVLRIRSIRLEVPVYADLNERNLNRGAVFVPGTASPDSEGNVAIAAHRDGFFRALEGVAVGAIVEVESRSRRRLYRVTELLIVEPTDTSSLRVTKWPALTLVTCYPFYFVGSAPQRFIVRAVAVS
jgi:sortase A